MESVKVEGQKRTEIGSKDSKSLRNEGRVPCVVYGKEGLTHFSIIPKAIKSIVYSPDFKLVDLDINGKTTRAILKDIQFHPVTDKIVHVDFLQLNDGIPVKVNIPLRPKGDAEGVKGGGKLIQQVRSVLVKVLPKDLVSELYVDVTSLELGQSARIRDIEVPDAMEIMNPAATPVVGIEIPRALRSANDAAEEDDDATVVVPAAE